MDLKTVLHLPIPYRKWWVATLIEKFEKQQKAQNGDKGNNDNSMEKLMKHREQLMKLSSARESE